eukprot:2974881-Prymnesium_polylepis.1
MPANERSSRATLSARATLTGREVDDQSAKQASKQASKRGPCGGGGWGRRVVPSFCCRGTVSTTTANLKPEIADIHTQNSGDVYSQFIHRTFIHRTFIRDRRPFLGLGCGRGARGG